MSTPPWQLITPISAVIFDCDGTLSRIEGIDELAKNNHVSNIVQRLTADAMGKSGMSAGIYAERLALTQPTQKQVDMIGTEYFKQRAPDIDPIIQILNRLNKAVYIISAGLRPAVEIFGKLLQIPEENIIAVDIHFDAMGKYHDFDRTSPLINKNGKRIVVDKIKFEHPNLAYVGDGLSDYEVYDLVSRFIGYGGAFYRENIAALCQFYLKTLSMGPLLPFILTQDESTQLTATERKFYLDGLAAIQDNQVLIKSKH